jgi:hypothetical protein
MKIYLRRFSVVLMVAATSITIPADATTPPKGIEILCPQEAKLQSLAVPVAPDGWTPLFNGTLMLNGVDLTSGSPAEKATLIPEIEGRGKSAIRKWRGLQAHSEYGVWVACRYGRSENAVLGRRIGVAVSECSAIDKTDGNGQLSISLKCQ